MKLQFQGQRILAVVAHADDVELLCAGTLARAQSDGAVVGMCTLCRGDKGGAMGGPDERSECRRREFYAAAEVLGAEAFFGDVPDGELFDSVPVRHALVKIYRQFSPTIILAHAPEDYHPDHRAAGALAEAASWFAAAPGQPVESPPLERAPALIWMDTINMSGFEPGFFVDVSHFLTLKEKMLTCHRSQLQRGMDTDFEPLRQVMLRQATTRGAQSGVAAAEAFRIHPAWKRVMAW
jgi:LmbE family N-acetylglucosaminyl deacetylase